MHTSIPTNGTTVYRGREERPVRPLVRLAVVAAYIFLLFLCEVAIVGALGVVVPPLRAVLLEPDLSKGTGRALAAQLLATLAVLAAVYVGRRTLDGRSFVSLGLEPAQALAHLATGILIGGLLGVVVPVALLLQGAVLRPGGEAPAAVVAALAIMAAGAFGEEVLFRGYVLANLEEEWGTPAAIIGSALLFACARLLNPYADLWAFAGSLALGVALAVLLVAFRSLWLTVGYHAAWNVVTGPLFGLPVSGLPAASLWSLGSEQNAPLWLSGGAFGPAASLVALAVHLTVAAGILLHLYGIYRRRST
jgi:membrane protease YdiL (CAAX protease family)